MINLISIFFLKRLTKTLLSRKLIWNFLGNILIRFFRKNLLGSVVIYNIYLITHNKCWTLLMILIAIIRIFRICMMQLFIWWLLCEAILLKLNFIYLLDFICTINQGLCHFIWLKIRWIIWINTWTYNISFFNFLFTTFVQIIFISLCYFLYKR